VTYDYTSSPYVNNGRVNMTDPVHGIGNLTVTTAGGTSAPLVLNEVRTAVPDQAFDMAFDAASGHVWMADSNTNPNALHLVDLTTGQTVRSITLAANNTQNFYSYAGLQVVGAAGMSLNGVSVPAGSLLLFNGYLNKDQVIALNSTTGAVIASLTLAQNYDLTAGVYDPVTGHLFINDRRASPQKVIEINPVNGVEIATLAPFTWNTSTGYVGMAIDPVTGNLWFGADSSNVVEVTKAGVIVRTVSLASQGVNDNHINGLSFDVSGKMLVADYYGHVFKVTLPSIGV
jgi:hypothetical protein